MSSFVFGPRIFAWTFTLMFVATLFITFANSLLLEFALLSLGFFHLINYLLSSLLVLVTLTLIEDFLKISLFHVTTSILNLLLQFANLFNILSLFLMLLILFVSFNGFVELFVFHSRFSLFKSLYFLLLLQ